GLQGRSLHAQAGCSSSRSPDHPVNFAQYLQNQLTFRFIQRRSSGGGRIRTNSQFRKWSFQHQSSAENDGAFDEIFQLTNISRPAPVAEGSQRLIGDRRNVTVHAAAVSLREVSNQPGNILAA